MNIPPQAAILTYAAELRSDAMLAHDASTVKALDSIIVLLVCFYASLEWDGQYLMVASASHPGVMHAVSPFGCSCEAHRPCYHMRLRELLVDMFDEECTTADQAALGCVCGAAAQINDDERPGVVYCARCWMEREGIAIEV